MSAKMFLTREGFMFSHIKDSDLNFAGISKGFAAIGGASASCPNGDSVANSSYERPDALVPLADGRTLYAALGGSNRVRLTLIKGGVVGMELGWVSAKAMKDAIEVNHGLLKVNGKALAFGAITRSLRRVVAAAS